MYECTCPAARGLSGRICGVSHPDCEALKGLSTAALDLVVTPTASPPALILGPDQEPAAVPPATTTVGG
jgi:hypothetical protein